ncbi:MAG: energy transducer TonB [Steroidobacteraceae bacterium]
MAYGQARRGKGFFAGRGAVLSGVIGLHGVAVLGFMQVGLRMPSAQESPPVEVLFLEEAQTVQPPAPTPPKLVDVQPVDILAPIVDLPSDAPAPTAITVSPPKKPVAAAPVVAASETPVSVDAVDYLKPPSPRYPASAKAARVQGTVLLRVLIDRDGKPRDVVVQRSSGSAQLDAAARESVLQALFRPHRENGEARSALVTIPIEFALNIRTARNDRGRRDAPHGDHDERGPREQRVGHRPAD